MRSQNCTHRRRKREPFCRGGQRRPPLRVHTISQWYGQICGIVPPGGVEPLPYAAGGNFTDSHWRGPICRCVPHNPFVTASPCHLPLHKGGFSVCYKSKPPRGLYPSRRFLSKNLVLRNCCLQLQQTTVIIFLENKNAAACG